MNYQKKLRLVCHCSTTNAPREGAAEPRGYAFALFWFYSFVVHNFI